MKERDLGLVGVEIHGDYAAFWGSCFSNFFPCEFKLDGITWNCSEQYFMYRKATTFGDSETAQKILKTNNPSVAKKLGREVSNFDEKTWDIYKYHYMYKAVRAKFSQNEDLLNAMNQYQGKSFVEGSPVDKIWGVGLVWTDDNIADPKNWDGQNLLGKVLNEVREELNA